MSTAHTFLHRASLALLVSSSLAAGCGDDADDPAELPNSESSTTDDGATTAPPGTTGTADDDSGGSSGMAPPVDPYGPCEADRTCPGGGECVSFGLGHEVCMPLCDGEGPAALCPEPVGGTATSRCAVNTSSSNVSCRTNDDCTNEGETCLGTSAGMICQRAATHCILLCQLSGGCPEGMACTSGVCHWPT